MLLIGEQKEEVGVLKILKHEEGEAFEAGAKVTERGVLLE